MIIICLFNFKKTQKQAKSNSWIKVFLSPEINKFFTEIGNNPMRALGVALILMRALIHNRENI